MDQEPLSPFYYSTKKTTPVVPPVAETATEEKPATRVPEILSEERILENLRRLLKRLLTEYKGTNTELRQYFWNDRKKIYPDHLHLIEQVLDEILPAGEHVPEPEQSILVPETKDIITVSATENETLASQGTLDTWVDEVLAEIPEPQHVDIPHWKSQQLKTAHEQKLTKRQVERRFLKDKMRYYVDSNPTEEFSVKVLCALFPERKADTITAIIKELWQEGLVKGRIEVRTLSRKPKKSTCSYVITSLANPSTNYYTEFPKDNLWFKKKKIGTRHSSSEPDSQEIGTRQDEN